MGYGPVRAMVCPGHSLGHGLRAAARHMPAIDMPAIGPRATGGGHGGHGGGGAKGGPAWGGGGLRGAPGCTGHVGAGLHGPCVVGTGLGTCAGLEMGGPWAMLCLGHCAGHVVLGAAWRLGHMRRACACHVTCACRMPMRGGVSWRLRALDMCGGGSWRLRALGTRAAWAHARRRLVGTCAAWAPARSLSGDGPMLCLGQCAGHWAHARPGHRRGGAPPGHIARGHMHGAHMRGA